MPIQIPITPRIPVRVIGSGPMGATLANGVLTLNWDMARLPEFTGDASGFYVPVYNPATDTHGKMTLEELLAYVQTVVLGTQTGQIRKAAVAAFTTISGANWANFITNYVSDSASTDGTYEAAFVSAFAPVNGQFWGLFIAYFEAIGMSPIQATTAATAIWAAAPATAP